MRIFWAGCLDKTQPARSNDCSTNSPTNPRPSPAGATVMNFVGLLGRVRLAPLGFGKIRRADTLCNALAWLTLAGTVIVVLATFPDYGVTWDEDLHNWYGIEALNYYLSGFADTRALHFPDLVNYGAAFDMLAAGVNRLSPLGVYETRHLLNA